MTGPMDERDEVTLRTLAALEHTSLAEQRRKALRHYAARARRRKQVAYIVGLMLASRQEQRARRAATSNVIPLAARRGAG